MTAPIVPPKTISAADGCSTWVSLPPSSTKPIPIPKSAMAIPPMVLLSTLIFTKSNHRRSSEEPACFFLDGQSIEPLSTHRYNPNLPLHSVDDQSLSALGPQISSF